jgi:hypothetical protein
MKLNREWQKYRWQKYLWFSFFERRIAGGYDRECHIGKSTDYRLFQGIGAGQPQKNAKSSEAKRRGQKNKRNETRIPPIGTNTKLRDRCGIDRRMERIYDLRMGYQPNPFVNPNQRGVELPAGCKDLMDVLKIGGSQQAPGRVQVSHGVLSDVEKHVGEVLESASKQLFSVGIPKRRILVILGKREDGLMLNFSIPAKQQSVVRRMFQEPKIGRPIDGMEYVSVTLGPAKDVVAMTIVELLVEGFGVTEGERMMFCSYESAKGKAEG